MFVSFVVLSVPAVAQLEWPQEITTDTTTVSDFTADHATVIEAIDQSVDTAKHAELQPPIKP